MLRHRPLTSVRKIDARFTTKRFAIRAALFAAISLSTSLLVATLTRTSYVKSNLPSIRVHVDGQSKLLNLQEAATQPSVDYQGSAVATEALRSGSARPLSLASGDLDADGAADLVSGYGYGDIGMIAIRRANLGAFQTQDPNVYQRALKGEVAATVLSRADVYQVPQAPNFLAVADFDGDGYQDVLAATIGGGLYLLAGDGSGSLLGAEQIGLTGKITAIAAGTFNRGSERSSVVVGVDGQDGPALLVFEGQDGGLHSQPKRYPLSSAATVLALGRLDNDSFTDVAIGLGNQVEIIHGGGWNNSDPDSRIERIDVPFEIRSLAIGDFIWDRDFRSELALLSPDGNVHLYAQGQLDTRPFTDADKPALYARRVAAARQPLLTFDQQKDIQEQSKWGPSAKEAWSDAQQFVAVSATGNLSAQTLMTGSHTTGRRTDDLFALDAQAQQVHILVDTSTVTEPWNPRVPVTLDVDGAPLAVMAMPQKINASRDLLVLNSAHPEAGNIVLAPQATFTVTQTADRASTCGTGGQCSLREAINSANSAAGTNTVGFSVNGTFTNTLGQFPAQGDVNSTNITILGSSPANTIIANTGSGVGHSVLYYGFNANQTFKVQNLSLINGNTGDGFGGGALATGGTGWLVTVDNCVLNNNVSQSTDNGGAISQSGGGNFVIQNNSVLSNNTATAAIGGGIAVNNSTNVGGLTITNSTITGNTATAGAGAGQGGGVWIGVESSGSSVVTISQSTITNNVAGSQQGGGIFTNKGTIQFNRIVGNTAVTGGTGIFEPGGGFTVTANNNWWGCNTGPNGTATGGCSVAPNTTSGFTAPTAWLQLRNVISGANVHNANQIAPGSNATFSADILGLNTGGTTAAGNLTGLATFPIAAGTIYSNGSPSLATSFTPTTGQYVNGVANASALFTSNGTKGTATVNSIADNQTFGVPLVIGFTPEFVNPAGNDTIASAFSSVACGAGNTPCFATVGAALTNVAVSGIINIQAGTYAENPNFNQNCTTNVTGNITLNGITLTNGTFNASSFTTALAAGNWTNNGGVFTQATSTISFTGAGAQSIGGSVSTTFNNLTINNAAGVSLTNSETVGGTLTLTSGTLGVGTNTLTLNGAVSFTSGSFTSSATGTVNYNQGSNGQGVAPGSYGNLTFSNFNKTLPATGTVGVAGTFTTGSAVGHTITNSTFDFNGAGTQTVPAFNYNNLTISGNRGTAAITLGSGNIGIAGTFSPTATNNTWVNTGNTVVFNGGVAQTIPAFAFFNGLTLNNASGANLGGDVTVGGALTLTSGALGVGTNTLTLNGAVSTGGGTLTSGTTGTVNYNQGSNGQATVLAANYGNLTFSNFNKTLASSGTIGIAGTFTPGTGAAHTITGSTINFNGAGSQTIPGFTYNNLTSSSGAAARTLDSVNTIKIAGTFTPGTNTYTITGSTIEYNGSAAQILPASGFNTYNNLTLNNPTTTTGFAGLTVNGLIEVKAGTFTSSSTYNNVQIDSGATLAATAASTINVSGNWTNNGGTFTPNTGTVNLNGAGSQTIGGTGTTTFNNLTVSNTTPISMTNDNTVSGVLALTNADINVASTKTLTQNSATASTGTFDVTGNVKRTGAPLASATGYTFGNPNNVITFTAAGTRPTDVTVNLDKHVPGPTNGAPGFPNAVQRTYTISQNGGVGFSATLRLHYLTSELNGNIEGPTLNLWQFNGTGWAPRTQTANSNSSPNNWVEKSGVTGFSPWTLNSTLSPTASNGSIGGSITDTNGAPVAGAVINLTGAQSRKTITDANGNYHFDNVETDAFYTVTPSRANFVFSPANRSFTQTGNKTEAAFTGSSGGDTANPLDTPEYFVRQQYVDVLSREPDEGGFNYWSDQINACGNDADCIRSRRISVAAAFFIEQEFQQTGSFIYDMYSGALARRPVFVEYASDRTQVIGGANLDSEKAAFANSFVQRAEFVAKYQSNVSADSFVDALLQSVQTSGVDLSGERTNLISTYNGGASTVESRAAVVRAVADNAAFKQAQYNPAFVLTEYFAYLSRDIDQGGYDFWLNVLNNREPGNFRGMVCAFVTSTEYQKRFSSVISRNNSECAR